jgi:hypothetical protein
MSKISYYGKRPSGQNSYNYNYGTYNYQHKKNYFKNKNKLNNSYMNNYFEERKKNYNYYDNPNSNSFYSFPQKNYYQTRYNPFKTEEKKLDEGMMDDYFNDEEKKNELLRIRINVSEKQYKELVICKNDDVNKKVIEFCKDNFINEKLIEPLVNKVNQGLNTLKLINNNFLLDEKDFIILNKLRNVIGKKNKNNY